MHNHPERPALADLDLVFTYSVCGFALSLLLVFKTNTAYARFWEGAVPSRTGLPRRQLILGCGTHSCDASCVSPVNPVQAVQRLHVVARALQQSDPWLYSLPL